MKSELFQHISYKKAYRTNRLNAANWVLENPETLEELLEYCFHEDNKLATKATWVLEFVCRKNLALIFPFLDYIFGKLPTAKSDGQLRSFGLICELLTIGYYKQNKETLKKALSSKHKEVMTECCFDWMLTNQKVACQARAMTTLYLLGTETDWIHPELAIIIQQNLLQGSAGYISRGQKTLESISGFSKK
ncbi:adenylosuccinate lyase [Rasiella sp. SM2506]|uniref:adenylosuccinate lyase n=1 Tax=Rasiella sp. SM2506 TaxID=3423914 RepID=UPI003D7A99F0